MIISELMTGRVMRTYAFPAVIQEVRWNPSALYADVIAVACDLGVYLIDTELSGNADVHRRCRDLLLSRRRERDPAECRGVEWLVNPAARRAAEAEEAAEAAEAKRSKGSEGSDGSDGSNGSDEAKKSSAEASKSSSDSAKASTDSSKASAEVSKASAAEGGASEVFVDPTNVVVLRYSSPVKDMAWHHKGDYFCVNASSASASVVYIHQLSKGTSQIPISKLKGLVQRVLFSPSSLPYLFVATQTEVKIYNLVKQTLVNKLRTGVKWVSSMAVGVIGVCHRRSILAETTWSLEASTRASPGSISTSPPRPTRRCDITRRPFARCSSTIPTLS